MRKFIFVSLLLVMNVLIGMKYYVLANQNIARNDVSSDLIGGIKGLSDDEYIDENSVNEVTIVSDDEVSLKGISLLGGITKIIVKAKSINDFGEISKLSKLKTIELELTGEDNISINTSNSLENLLLNRLV